MYQVASKCCSQCLFTDNKIVDDKRKKAIIKDCVEKDIHFVCHKATMQGKDVCCRGYYENHSSNLMRIAQRLGAIEFVDTEKTLT